MVLVQGLLALVTRQASKLLNTAFGWATMLLFGQVPQDRQLALSAITFGSVLWLTVLIGIAFPRSASSCSRSCRSRDGSIGHRPPALARTRRPAQVIS